VFAMIAFGLLQMVAGHPPVAESAAIGIRAQEQASGLLLVALVLRAFASGCTALTGVGGGQQRGTKLQESQESQAAGTLAIMGTLTIVMFVGITALAQISKVHVGAIPAQLVGAPQDYVQRTVIAQIAGAVFGYSSLGSTPCRPSPPRSWCWPPTPPSTVSRSWPRSFVRTGSCRCSSPGGAIGWCSPTAS
jgi:hypothetical protein